MVPALCHPDRKHYAKGYCWPCYAKRWKAVGERKDGAWARYRREQQLVKRQRPWSKA